MRVLNIVDGMFHVFELTPENVNDFEKKVLVAKSVADETGSDYFWFEGAKMRWQSAENFINQFYENHHPELKDKSIYESLS